MHIGYMYTQFMYTYYTCSYINFTGKPTGQVTFPIDFFEHVQQSSDVEVKHHAL